MSIPVRTRSIALGTAILLFAACEDNGGGPIEPTPLAAPQGVTVSALTPTSARVSFQVVSGADSYLVQRAPGAGGSFAEAGTTTSTTFDDVGLDPGASFRYRVAARRGSETSAFSGEVAVDLPERPLVTITSDITSNRTLTADTIYVLGNFVHVANGATLTIEAGTRIEGQPQSALFVLRGARIEAVGTAEQPIVMTSTRPPGQREPGDWGGLILVGNATLNRGPSVLLEGTGTNISNYAIDYAGGTDDGDDSGELRYVRVEFAGFGPAPDAELNSFTFAALGSGTQLSYLQSLAGLDDSFEWFGGTADAKYLVSYESGDDHFDMSEGYRGRVQYAIAYQSTVLPPRAGAGNTSNDPQGIENDGCAGANCFNGQNSEPLTIPMIANFTLVGTGPDVVPAGGGRGVVLRRGTGGYYVNGVIARWPAAALAIRDDATNARMVDGDFDLRNMLLVENGTAFETGTERFSVDETANEIESAGATATSLFAALPVTPTAGSAFDWTPAANSAAAGGGLDTFSGALAAKAGSFVAATTFRGAADPTGPKWWEGWTTYARN
ncbi:MAG: fibronectin type III domain-containing protein [Longimicrobiales bacterium]